MNVRTAHDFGGLECPLVSVVVVFMLDHDDWLLFDRVALEVRFDRVRVHHRRLLVGGGQLVRVQDAVVIFLVAAGVNVISDNGGIGSLQRGRRDRDRLGLFLFLGRTSFHDWLLLLVQLRSGVC